MSDYHSPSILARDRGVPFASSQLGRARWAAGDRAEKVCYGVSRHHTGSPWCWAHGLNRLRWCQQTLDESNRLRALCHAGTPRRHSRHQRDVYRYQMRRASAFSVISPCVLHHVCVTLVDWAASVKRRHRLQSSSSRVAALRRFPRFLKMVAVAPSGHNAPIHPLASLPQATETCVSSTPCR
jgi:hypothetical protein